MSRHKNPRLNVRNWEDFVETENKETAAFEKLRHPHHEEQPTDSKLLTKPRQTFHRERF